MKLILQKFDDFNLEQPNNLISIERNGYDFQVSTSPFCRFRYKGKKKQVVAHKYFLGMHMIAGHGHIDALEKIRVGEKVVWEESDVLKDNWDEHNTGIPLFPHIWTAQTFVASSCYTLSAVHLKLYKHTANQPGTIIVSIRTTDIEGHPTGDDLCIGTIDGDTIHNIITHAGVPYCEIEFTAPIILTLGTKYAIIVRSTVYNQNAFWEAESDMPEVGNIETSSDMGVTWISYVLTDLDCIFKCIQKDGSAPNRTITINSPNIFGGDKKEGGIKGNVDLMFGDITQAQNDYLIARHDSNIPAFRGLFSAILKQVYIGTSPYLKPWSFFLKRVCLQISGDRQWYWEKAVIRPREEAGDDLNAAHIIRECLIDPEWGLGWSSDDIDDDAWREAADTLYDEDFGLSMLWDQVIPVEDFVDDILSCIAGMLYQDLATGKWILTLTRDPDYDNPYDYNNIGEAAQASLGTYQDYHLAQTFTISRNYSCNKIKIKCHKRLVGDTFNVRCELQKTDTNGHPNGTVLATGLILNDSLSSGLLFTDADWVECLFNTCVNFTVNIKYALVIYLEGGLGTFYWVVSTSNLYSEGTYEVSIDNGATWLEYPANANRWFLDVMFEIYAGGGTETFNEDDIISVDEFTRPSYGEITNLVTVNWWDKLAHKSRSAEARDIALIEKQGGAVIDKIFNYQGICNATLAKQVAERELKLASSMIAGLRLKCTRKMSHLKPNSLFKLSWSDLDITEMTVRVLNVNYGNLNKNEVYLTCVEDSFSTAATIYGDAPVTLWTDSINDPVDITNRRLVEIPYWSLVNHIIGSLSLVSVLDNDIGFLCSIAGKPTEDAFDYDILARLSAFYSFEDVGVGNNSFTPIGVLTNNLAMNAEDIIITLSSESDLDLVEVGTYAILNNEIVKILIVDTANNQVTIARGILDTVPAAHSSDDIIYFMGLNYGEVDVEYTNGDTPSVKLLPRTAKGSLAEADATIETASALDSRMIRPYPPGNLKFNDESYPEFVSSAAHGNKIAISWNHRDRTDSVQLNSLVKHTDSSIGPESGVTYVIKVYDADGFNEKVYDKDTFDSPNGPATPFDYTEAMEESDFGSLQEQLRFVIYAVRAGYSSFNDGYDITIRRVFRGTVEATSDLWGWLIPYFDGRDCILPISSVDGNLSVMIELGSSIVEISGASGGLGSIKVATELQGSIIGISEVGGTLGYINNIEGSAGGISGISGNLTSGELIKYESYEEEDYLDRQHISDLFLDELYKGAQLFTSSVTHTIKKVSVYGYTNFADGTPNLQVEIQGVDGEGKPDGNVIASGSSLLDSGSHEEGVIWQDIILSSTGIIIASTQYALVLRNSKQINTDLWRWYFNPNYHAAYPGGYRLHDSEGSGWIIDANADYSFKEFGTPI